MRPAAATASADAGRAAADALELGSGNNYVDPFRGTECDYITPMEEFTRADIWAIAEAVAPEETRRAHSLYKTRAEPGWRAGPEVRAAEAALERDLDGLIKSEEQLVDSLLRQISPVVALAILADGGLSNIPALQMLSHHVGFDRFVWALAVGASGDSDATELANEYLASCSRWATLSFLVSLFRTHESVGISLALNPGFEAIRRQMPSQVRFGWVSRLLMDGAVEVCNRNGQKYGDLATILSAEAVAGMFDYLHHGFFFNSHRDMLRTTFEVGEPAQSLMRAMSLESGELNDRSFAKLVLGRHAEVYPFVDFGNGFVVVMAGREAVLATEVALFELARRRLLDPNSHGHFYEEVLEYCLRRVVPGGLDVLVPPLNINIPGLPDPGEVDFAMTSKTVIVVGEAKAYLFPTGADAVLNAFGTEIKKASQQLQRRTQALTGGSAVESAARPGDKQELWTQANSRAVRGVGVPLHAYATAVWNRDSLEAIDCFDAALTIIPIHQFLIVMSLLTSDKDVDEYLDFRHAIISAGVQIFDELDIMRVYLNDAAKTTEDVQTIPDGEKLLLRGASLSHEAAVALGRPWSRTFWRASFSMLVEPIHLAAPE